MCKIGKIMAEFDDDYLKAGDGPNSREGVTKQLLDGWGQWCKGEFWKMQEYKCGMTRLVHPGFAAS